MFFRKKENIYERVVKFTLPFLVAGFLSFLGWMAFEIQEQSAMISYIAGEHQILQEQRGHH